MAKQENIQDKIKDMNFETAFSRLEEILEKMNSGTIPLDESLHLYEEADALINSCSKKLNEAERRIEVLVKNRNGELVLGNDQRPVTQEFNTANSQPPHGSMPKKI